MASANQASKLKHGMQTTLKLYIKDLRDVHGRRRTLYVRSWATVKDVKDQLQQLLHVPPSTQHLYAGPNELPNYRSLHDAGIDRSGQTLLLVLRSEHQSSRVTGGTTTSTSTGTSTATRRTTTNALRISDSLLDAAPPNLRRIVAQCGRGLALGYAPRRTLEGSGGTYYLHDARKARAAVFKPADEEPYAANNPRGYVSSAATASTSLRPGLEPGKACLREVAAFLLDHGGRGGVPPTTLVEAAHHPAFSTGAAVVAPFGAAPFSETTSSTTSQNTTVVKVGSCQQYMPSQCTMDDISPSKIGVEEVHKIVVLDIRLMNADRNAANLLVQGRSSQMSSSSSSSYTLVPIDHGYCLRTVCDVAWFDWCWLDWHQLKVPPSAETLKYVADLDVTADVNMLKDRLQLETDAIDYFRISTTMLQTGLRKGLTLYEIAVLCCRNDDCGESPSRLEVLAGQARELTLSALQNERWGHVAASRALAQRISPRTMMHTTVAGGIHQNSNMGMKSVSMANFSSTGGPEAGMMVETYAEEQEEEEKKNANESFQNLEEEDMDLHFLQEEDDEEEEEEGKAREEDQDEKENDPEQWAAGIVETFLTDSMAHPSRPQRRRSSSVESNSSDDTPNASFWRVAPGSSKAKRANSTLSEASEFSWSSSRSSSSVSSSATSSPSTSPPSRASSSPLTSPTTTTTTAALLGRVLVRSKSYSAYGFRTLRSMEDNDNLKGKYSNGQSKPGGGGSNYANNHSRSLMPGLANGIGRANSELVKSDQYRQYFFKFVDLLIERETNAQLHRRAQGPNNL